MERTGPLFAIRHSPFALPGLLPVIALDHDDVSDGAALLLGLCGLVLGRAPAGERGLVGRELEDDVAGAALALDDLAPRPAAHEEAPAELRKGGAVRCDVVLVGVGVLHVDGGDPIALRHHGAPSTATMSAWPAPSRFFFAAWYSGEW